MKIVHEREGGNIFLMDNAMQCSAELDDSLGKICLVKKKLLK